jgi:transcription elongation GreA/GreB family factor
MSRAFTKEADGDAAVEDLPEIPISPYPNIVTARGLQLIEGKLAQLRGEIEEVDGKDRATTARLARDLRYWTARRASAETASPPASTDEVRFGHSVTLLRHGQEETFRIVGQDEADPSQGLLSYVSPLGRALVGSSAGDVVTMGDQDIEILKINI